MTTHAHSAKPSYMRWHPKTGEATVFNSLGDIPADYLDRHPEDTNTVTQEAAPAPKVAEKVKAAELPMDRKAIRTALGEGGIAYDKTAPTQALYDLLLTSVRGVLTEMEVPFDADADAKTLLGLLPPSE